MDDLLKSLGIDTHGIQYDDMSKQEKDTLTTWLDSLQKNELTIERVKQYVHDMRDAIEQEFTKWDLPEKQDIYLKARLRNIMLLESFLSTPERAKRALETAIREVR